MRQHSCLDFCLDEKDGVCWADVTEIVLKC